MLPTRDLEQQYVVSLDNIDLSFLQQYIEKPDEGERLLWSVPDSEAESKLYEVKLVTEEVDENSSCIEPSKTVICHICNIDVPQMYLKQHNKSEMHKNYTLLIKKILENASKQLNIDIENVIDDDQSEKFYCEICSKVVLVSNRRKHIKSDYHLKCKETQEKVDIFIKLYTKEHEDASNIDTSDCAKEYSVIDADNDEELESSLGSDWCYTDSEGSADNEITDNSDAEYVRESPDSENSKEENKIQTLEFNFDESVEIVTPKGFKEKVNMKIFHSFFEHSSLVFCQLCDAWLYEGMQQHSKTKQHLMSIAEPIKDDFTRIVLKKATSHCLLCNTLVMNTERHYAAVHKDREKRNNNEHEYEIDIKIEPNDKHITSNTFDTNVKSPSLKSETRSNEPTQNVALTTAQNEIGAQYLDSKPIAGMQINETQKSPIEEENLQQNRVKPIQLTMTQWIELDTLNLVAMAVSQAKYLQRAYNGQLIEASNSHMTCLICESDILKTDIQNHLESFHHMTKLNRILHENTISKAIIGDEKRYTCYRCNENVIDFIEHINRNVSHIKKRILSNGICKLKLRAYIYEDLSKYSGESEAYHEIYRDLLKENMIFHQNNNRNLYCAACKIKIAPISEIDHMFGQCHVFFLEAKLAL